jgi:large-conductance mechanosensitive channel
MNNLGKGLSAVGSALAQVVEWILTPVIYLIAGIFWVIKWLLSILNGDVPAESQNITSGQEVPFGEVFAQGLPPWLNVMLKWIAVALIIALIIFILAKTISKYRAKKAQEEMDEVNESLFSWKGLKDDLKEFLNGMGNRFKRKPGAAASTFDPDATGRMDIREIFKHLQWEGQKSGITRQRNETAAEYTRRLGRAVPDSIESIQVTRESISGIKEMYESVRYGETAIPEPQVDKANSFWQTIKGMLRKIRGE